jgi:hypothetical protein
MPFSITSRIPVPAARPGPLPYAGRHRAPEPTVEIHRPVGEVTRDRRPNDLAQWEGKTRQLTPTPAESAQIRAAAGVL